MTTYLQNMPYLQRQRNFPSDDVDALSTELDKAYIDIATTVNSRTIGIFSSNLPAITGETWYLVGSKNKQQTLRQVYSITSLTNFNHGIKFSDVAFFTVIRGIGFDGLNYFPIPFIAPNFPTSGLGIFVSPTEVIFDVGATRTFVSGLIILEWLTNVVTNT